ncbi:D-amino acid dehydrogenase [Microvirga sp. VF16]|uniref:D-amino acid dehydrogenase n=1 Tax=Microvirga sp. VF16 TaxID=2807101 RepID=UPI00193EA9D5|nr:D-amino acid dehydrogenase [Microvirga sp. VF16]QRM32271.1 D-amino acid dehydrogenase [Microvirga sp. VF16]
MSHITVIGAGIAGITTAYALLQRGYDVTVIERHPYSAMETSFANGGQLSASNAEVWNHSSTILKGLRWMLQKDAPLLFNPKPSWHKLSWVAEFIAQIPHYRRHTVDSTRLAIQARQHLFDVAEREGIEFDHERRGILHIYHDRAGFDHAASVNELLNEGGLDRRAVTPEEIKAIEPTLHGDFYGGFFTPSDSTGDIHKFTQGLAAACARRGARFIYDAAVTGIVHTASGIDVEYLPQSPVQAYTRGTAVDRVSTDGIVICAGTASRQLAALLGDRVNIYPVKGYSITVSLDSSASQNNAPWVSLLDDKAKIVTSRLGTDRLRVAGTAEFNGYNKDIRADRIQPLVDWTRGLFPEIEMSKVIPWCGLRPMMPNMLPITKASRRPNVFYNTGHGHLGWTLSAATAEIVAEMIGQKIRPDRVVNAA